MSLTSLSRLLHRAQPAGLNRAAAGLVAAAALCSAALAQSGAAVLAVGADFKAAEHAAQAFEVPDREALKGARRVAVTSFAVEFVTFDSVQAQTSGFGSAGRANSALYFRLLGVGQPEFQALTEKLHAEFLQRLAASGVEVLPQEQILAQPLYRKLAAGGQQLPLVQDRSMTLSPPGLGVFGLARMATKPAASPGLLGALSNIGNGLAVMSEFTETGELAKALDAQLLEVRMRVNFVELTNHNRGFWGRMAHTASTSGAVGPSIDSVVVGVQTGPRRTTLTLKPTLALDPGAFSAVREKAATAGDVAGAVFVGLLRMASGSKDSYSSKEMEAVADPARYPEVVATGGARLAELVAVRLAAER